MVSFKKKNLIDIKSPNPSVETFLHAFLPFKFVDHTHADAILNITISDTPFLLALITIFFPFGEYEKS